MSRYFKDLIENCIKANEEFEKGMDKLSLVPDVPNKESKIIEDKIDELCEIVKGYGITAEEFTERFNKPLAPIQITEFEAEILWRYAKDFGTPNTVKDYNVLTKFNGREVIIL